VQQFQPLGIKRACDVGNARDVTTGSIEAGDQANPDRIGAAAFKK
jgi:hypothetical protein